MIGVIEEMIEEMTEEMIEEMIEGIVVIMTVLEDVHRQETMHFGRLHSYTV
jgi:hypothetical protein